MESKSKKSRKVRRNSTAQSHPTKDGISKSAKSKRPGQSEIENEGNMVVNISVLEGGKLILNSSTHVHNISE